jgi:hypothetical protein
MKKLFTTTMLLIAVSVLSGCGAEKAQKAAVDVKSAAAKNADAAKAATAGQKPAPQPPAATTASTSAKAAPAPADAKPAPDAKKPAAADAAKAPANAAKAPADAKTPVAADAAKTPASADAAKKPAANDPKSAAAKSAKVDDPPPPLSVPPGFEYTPRGRRDPFINPVPRPQVGGTTEEALPLARPDGLPGVLVSEVKLTGIVHSADPTLNKAMLVVGKNTYFGKRGDSLFDGVIKEIRRNEVVFAMVSATTRKPINRDTVVRTGSSSGTSAGEKK